MIFENLGGESRLDFNKADYTQTRFWISVFVDTVTRQSGDRTKVTARVTNRGNIHFRSYFIPLLDQLPGGKLVNWCWLVQ